MDRKKSSPSVCVLIVSYNFERWIDKCITSLQNSSFPVSIVVVDNGSEDNTCNILQKSYPEVQLIKNSDNMGFGRANNAGMEYITEQDYKYAFLLNQDAWIETETISRLVDAAEKNRDYGILSPVHLNGNGNAADLGFYEYTGIRNREDALKLNPEVIEYKFINAAMWLIPVSTWNDVGGFATIFSHYGEDLNWTQRSRKLGYKVGVVKSAFGYHDREERPLSRTKFFYSEYVYFLTEAVNPFHSAIQAMAYSFLASIKKGFTSMFSDKMKDSKEYFKIAGKLVKKSRQIIRVRKETKVH